ncbi:MAG: tRNA (adenosine(37)-N6)-threonylcarbamoyltransferase complex dimerization subunit type 1 TsaB [Endomicrobium sp.]|jgi:tRNA threonylcarbamoyladenosine biosynthesis protein TsaB|nr:tRNA (adenosine(37)-N6)-threonylcarbamoyltransferase complex dimerization subunit type 1 TsaB [Endomicrobium sp.]
MKILALETSGKSLSTALNENGKTVAEFFYDHGHIHSEMLIPSIERILEDTGNTYKDIDKFAVSAGPGSFTGIRVAMTAVKTLAQSLNKPAAVVDTLTVLKNALNIKGIKIVPAIDALRNEVYIKIGKKVIIKSIDSFADSLKAYKNRVLIVGSAAISYRNKLAKTLGNYSVSLPETFHLPKASVLAVSAQFEKDFPFDKVEPLYIRRSWAEETQKRHCTK